MIANGSHRPVFMYYTEKGRLLGTYDNTLIIKSRQNEHFPKDYDSPQAIIAGKYVFRLMSLARLSSANKKGDPYMSQIMPNTDAVIVKVPLDIKARQQSMVDYEIVDFLRLNEIKEISYEEYLKHENQNDASQQIEKIDNNTALESMI